MRKFLFYFSLVLFILLLLNVAEIIISDFHNLTRYGFGYLAGKVILVILFGTSMYFTRNKKASA